MAAEMRKANQMVNNTANARSRKAIWDRVQKETEQRNEDDGGEGKEEETSTRERLQQLIGGKVHRTFGRRTKRQGLDDKTELCRSRVCNVRASVGSGKPRPAVSSDPARCANCSKVRREHVMVREIVHAVTSETTLYECTAAALRSIWRGQGRDQGSLGKLEKKWLKKGGGKMKQTVEALSKSLKGREGGAAEAVLGAMGAGVGPAAEGGEAESMEEFTTRRIGRAHSRRRARMGCGTCSRG